MSRVPGSPDTIVVKPTSNVYTVLTILGTIVTLLALATVYLKADKLFVPPPETPNLPHGLLG